MGAGGVVLAPPPPPPREERGDESGPSRASAPFQALAMDTEMRRFDPRAVEITNQLISEDSETRLMRQIDRGDVDKVVEAYVAQMKAKRKEVSVDITSAYHHVELWEPDTKYFGFAWEGRTYRFRSLPFGLSVACWGRQSAPLSSAATASG